MTGAEALTYRFTRDEFLRAWEAGAFDRRVEFIDGEVWPVVLGDWHGVITPGVVSALPNRNVRVTMSTLPSGDSLPDPDVWVRTADAQPRGKVGARLSVWRAEDVLLVVEVSDETVTADLTVKARLYGSAGYAVYWVVTQEVIYEHTEPTPAGYANRREYRSGDRIPVRYAGTELSVDELLND